MGEEKNLRYICKKRKGLEKILYYFIPNHYLKFTKI